MNNQMNEQLQEGIKLADRSKPLTLDKVRISDAFWSGYIRLVREVVVPYQWEALNDRVPEAEPSHAIQNFKIAAGEAEGAFHGMVFQDSDVAKWLEAVSYLLETEPDPALQQVADSVVELIAKAQQPDGYVNTYFTVKEPENRWTNLAECHELYCAGHLIEAAVAYNKATGNEMILQVACRFADYIDRVFGREPGKLNGYDGHQEIELALVKLYHATGKDHYLALSRYFIEQRGAKPSFYEQEWEKRGRKVHFPQLDIAHDLPYSQAHLPVQEQEQAVGHAVRVVYMCTAMADLAAETGDEALLQACKKLWDNIVAKRMYITGGIGSMAEGEAFTSDYDLPNDTAYAETCASIGLIFFAHRMLQIEPDSRYADVMERALYNTVVSGMARDGKTFFYVNPLEVNPSQLAGNKNTHHVCGQRQGWFGCACCPPNIARLLASLGQYVYTVQKSAIYVHLYVGGAATLEVADTEVQLEQKSAYTWDGEVSFTISTAHPVAFALKLRVPDWCGAASWVVNGGEPQQIKGSDIDNGYAQIDRVWQSGDTVELVFTMPIHRMKSHPLVRENAGKVALQRGPFVYCLEETDNGEQLYQLALPAGSELSTAFEPALLGGMQTISALGQRQVSDGWQGQLYRHNADWQQEAAELKFIPYFAWANRGAGEMAVWVRETT
ncbi:beta-L-arabinofuranosidase domain-containing protein [Paenibacillus sp. BIHB 4019]|nr:beta-L-arabinofuranosidase domain-containing protein [Paenibacillus sp. BIHB 4019]